MERDCVIAHGCAEFTKERLMDTSDAFRMHVCNRTGTVGMVNPDLGIFKSPIANGMIGPTTALPDGTGQTSGVDFSEIRMPYAFKLLMQELECMNITMRIMTDKPTVLPRIAVVPEDVKIQECLEICEKESVEWETY
jgi:DNA-directed RNA polymerase II subunit RPB2